MAANMKNVLIVTGQGNNRQSLQCLSASLQMGIWQERKHGSFFRASAFVDAPFWIESLFLSGM